MFEQLLLQATASDSSSLSAISDWTQSIGVDLFENEIDDVIFSTNQFLLGNGAATGGPFSMILLFCQSLAALFAIIVGAGIAYKMMVKGEPIDVFKILRIMGIAIVINMWYWGNGAMLTTLAYVPNCIGGYCKVLYESEASQVQGKYNAIMPLIQRRDSLYRDATVDIKSSQEATSKAGDVLESTASPDEVQTKVKSVGKLGLSSTFAGLIVMMDKLIMFLALVVYRIGWWSTIYCQQILLGMLTIFGPIQWAFSILPKWEGAWAKWLTRYLTVHFYGAMLYFVGFYILLLFDIVLSIQYENLSVIASGPGIAQYIVKNAFLTSGYLLVASVVALKCLNLVPDLAAWMIPEGDTAFSTRNFGEGVASDVKRAATSVMRL